MFTKEAIRIAHTLSDPSKMPGKSYSLPTHACGVGSTLRDVEGSVCSKCYADNRGNYRFGNVKRATEKRLEAIAHPGWVEAMATLIVGEEWFRWHDSGDLQGVSHYGDIDKIARSLPQTNFWLPTKEKGLVNRWLKDNSELEIPRNLCVRYSMPMIEQVPKLGSMKDKVLFSAVSRHVKVQEDLVKLDLKGQLRNNFFVCEAWQRGNQCGYCRACWDTTIPVIVYPYH